MKRVLATFLALVLIGCGGAQKTEEEVKDAQWHYQMGAAFFESHEVPLALRELTACLEKDPNHKEAHHMMGFIYMGRRDYKKSVMHLKRALEIDEHFHTARNNLGAVYLAQSRWEDAAGAFEQLLEEPLYPTPELAHNNLGWAKFNQRRYPEALEHFKMAVFLKPQLCLAHNNAGLTYVELNNGREAMASFLEAVRSCPRQYAEPHFHIGKLLAEVGDPNARKHFEECVRIEPSTTLGRRCGEYLGVR